MSGGISGDMEPSQLQSDLLPTDEESQQGRRGALDIQKAKEVWDASASLLLCWGPPTAQGLGRKTALQWGSTQKDLLLFSPSPFSPAEPSFMQTTL